MHIVLCYIEVNSELLLIKRRNNPYRNYFALIGGKVENGESVFEAAIREAYEESGLVISKGSIIGCASEVVIDECSGKPIYKYDMSLVKLDANSMDVVNSCEGELIWMSKAKFMCSEQVVPTYIDLVQRYLVFGNCERVSYTVVKSGEGEYKISSITAIE